jgi:hypothetical protein
MPGEYRLLVCLGVDRGREDVGIVLERIRRILGREVHGDLAVTAFVCRSARRMLEWLLRLARRWRAPVAERVVVVGSGWYDCSCTRHARDDPRADQALSPRQQ